MFSVHAVWRHAPEVDQGRLITVAEMNYEAGQAKRHHCALPGRGTWSPGVDITAARVFNTEKKSPSASTTIGRASVSSDSVGEPLDVYWPFDFGILIKVPLGLRATETTQFRISLRWYVADEKDSFGPKCSLGKRNCKLRTIAGRDRAVLMPVSAVWQTG